MRKSLPIFCGGLKMKMLSNAVDEDEERNSFVIHKINLQHNGVKYFQKEHPYFHVPAFSQDIYEVLMVQSKVQN